MKNIAGNDVSIFLFRFELRGNSIDFVLNEVIAEDMYLDIDEKMKPHCNPAPVERHERPKCDCKI